MHFFSFYPQTSDTGQANKFIPVTVHSYNAIQQPTRFGLSPYTAPFIHLVSLWVDIKCVILLTCYIITKVIKYYIINIIHHNYIPNSVWHSLYVRSLYVYSLCFIIFFDLYHTPPFISSVIFCVLEKWYNNYTLWLYALFNINVCMSCLCPICYNNFLFESPSLFTVSETVKLQVFYSLCLMFNFLFQNDLLLFLYSAEFQTLFC